METNEISAVLRDAVADALAADAKEKTVELTLNLSYQNEQWWILCDEALVNAVSGGILN